MACSNNLDFCVRKGETFRKRFMWNTGRLVTIPITAISQAAPARVTAAGHGLVNDWLAAVVSSDGMTAINAKEYPPEPSAYSKVEVVDSSNVDLVEFNSADMPAYTGGGYLVYLEPYDLVGATAVMNIRTVLQSGTLLKQLTSSPSVGIEVNDTLKTVKVEFATAAETWSLGFFDLEVTLNDGRIVEVATGTISIE